MKKRTVLWMAALTVCLLLVISALLMPRAGVADGGGFSGSSDYGGSSSDSCSGEGLFILFECARGASEAAASSGKCSGGQIVAFWIVLIVLVAVGFGVINSIRSRRAPAPGPERTAVSTLLPIDRYVSEHDPNFSAEDMKARLENLYIKLQDCCTRRDYEPVRPYFADSLYQRFNREAQQYKAAKRTNCVDRVAVLSVNLLGWYQENGNDVILASIYTRITDYTLDDETGKVLYGSKTAEKFMTYEYALSRPSGKTTDPEHEGVCERHCPNCGAPLSVNESIKCPYCDSVLTFSDHDWTVYMIRGISQRTVK
ncbi:MAG: zinc-ribbon domain-containing transport protein [Clostridia bacterium]|nr:zinc-ribbon domain-containing transport protein [Clostridia bacterium]